MSTKLNGSKYCNVSLTIQLHIYLDIKIQEYLFHKYPDPSYSLKVLSMKLSRKWNDQSIFRIIDSQWEGNRMDQ